MLRIVKQKSKAISYYASYYFISFKNSIQNLMYFLKIFARHRVKSKTYAIAIGTIFNRKGGVANHILATNKYVQNSSFCVPLDSAELDNNTKSSLYKKWCNRYHLISSPICHSHADSWFIKYCYSLKEKNLVKWVHTYHLPYFPEAHGALVEWQTDMNLSLFDIASKADTKISVSRWLKAYLKEEYNIETIYIPNGVDYEKCRSASEEVFVEKYKMKDFILFASKIDYVKNPIEFVQLAAEMPSEDFVMIGTNISKESLSAIYKKNLPSNLIIIAGYMDHAMTLSAIAASKVFVMTSRIEGLPTALMEAMALAKPVVASRVPGCEELIGEDEYGYLYKLGQIDDLKQKMVLALNNKSLGIKASRFIEKNFDWKVIAPQLDIVYNNLKNGSA